MTVPVLVIMVTGTVEDTSKGSTDCPCLPFTVRLVASVGCMAVDITH